jgi:regulatory protein YycI of two-component signal transduction system YycFG
MNKMDWNKTKTIFILTFLILNIFLSFKLIERENESQLEVITKSTIEDLLKEMEITYPKLPQIKKTETHISAINIPFNADELSNLKQQQYTLNDDGMLLGIFESPITLTNPLQPEEEVAQFISENIVNGTKYSYWKTDEEENKVYFFQTLDGKPIYFNKKAMLIIYLNEERQIIGYEQSFLTVQMKEVEQNILPPLKVIEVLLDKQYLEYEGTISKIELGYFNLPEIAGNIQVLAPTWHVVIGNNHYFVDAIDGELLKIGQNRGGEVGIAF